MTSRVYVALAVLIAVPHLSPSRTTGSLFSLGGAARTITQLPEWEALLGPFTAPTGLYSIAAPGLLWFFVVTSFYDRPYPGPKAERGGRLAHRCAARRLS